MFDFVQEIGEEVFSGRFFTERIYASDDLSGPAVTPVLTMTLRDVVVTDTRVTAKAVFYDPSNRGFPKQEYTTAQYPGLTAR